MAVREQEHVFLPQLETLGRDELENLQLRKLRLQLQRAWEHNSFYREAWQEAGVAPDDIVTREDISRLPFVTKQDVLADQHKTPPFGRRLGIPIKDVGEVTETSGTSGQGKELHGHTVQDMHLRGQMTATGWAWSGLARNDIAIFHIPATNSASLYTMLRGIRAVGRLPYLVGHMGFEQRLELMRALGVNAMYASPSGLNGLTTLCDQLGLDLREEFPELAFIMISGESWPVPWAERMQERWGARLSEVYGSTQTNAAYGAACCAAGAVVDGERAWLHLFEWGILYEVIDPETLRPAEPGQPGELVVTHLDKQASPLIRFRTGDRVTAFPSTHCPCGRQLTVLEAGTIGRIDDMLKIKGQNIWTSEVDQLIFAHDVIDEYQARVFIGDKGRDEVELQFSIKEGSATTGEKVKEQLTQELKDETNVTFRLIPVEASELPHFTSPDKKARRWKDERHAGLSRGRS